MDVAGVIGVARDRDASSPSRRYPRTGRPPRPPPRGRFFCGLGCLGGSAAAKRKARASHSVSSRGSRLVRAG